MPEYCEECNHEILPYLKTGEFKTVIKRKPQNTYEALKSKILDEFLVSYQFFFCISCKIVYYKEHERFQLEELKNKVIKPKEPKKKGEKNV